MHRKKKSGSHCRALPVPVHSETRCLALGKKPTRALARPTRRFDKDRVLQFDCKKIRLVHPPDRLTPDDLVEQPDRRLLPITVFCPVAREEIIARPGFPSLLRRQRAGAPEPAAIW